MNLKLTAFDRVAIREIFADAKLESGVIERLFATPESFIDQQGKVQFRLPLWMGRVCDYLQRHYSKSDTLTLILQLMRECILKGDYHPIPNFQSETHYEDMEETTHSPHRRAC